MGQGNYKLMSFDHSKLVTLKAKFPLVDVSLLALLMGDTVSTAAQNLFQRETQVVSGSNTVTLTQTPLANTTPYVYYLSGTRDNGTALTKVASTPAAGQYSISTNTITVNSADTGKTLVIWYQYASPASTTKFSMKANKFVQPMEIIGDGLATDQVTGATKSTKVTIYKAKFKPNFNLVMSSTAATSIDIEMDLYAVPQNGDLVYYDVVFLT